MSRHLISAAVLAVLAATALTGSGGRPAAPATAQLAAASVPSAAPQAAVAGRAAGKKDGRSAQQRAEDTYVVLTAKHLCTVASTVYTDPKAMADAYNTPPAYPGLTAQQIAQFRKRMASDKAFAARVTAELRKTCRPGTRK